MFSLFRKENSFKSPKQERSTPTWSSPQGTLWSPGSCWPCQRANTRQPGVSCGMMWHEPVGPHQVALTSDLAVIPPLPIPCTTVWRGGWCWALVPFTLRKQGVKARPGSLRRYQSISSKNELSSVEHVPSYPGTHVAPLRFT